MRLGRIATLAMLAIAAVAPAMAQTVTRSGEPFNPPVVSVRRYVTRTADSLGGHKAGMRDSAVWETPARSLPVPMPMGGMYPPDTSSRIFATDENGNLSVSDVSRDRDYSQHIPCIAAIACAGKAKIYQAYPVDIHEYSKLTVEVSWTYATADTGKLDSLMLEVIPYVKQSMTVDGYDFSVDLDPSTPLVNGVYITREATPLPVYGYGLASGIKFVVPTVTGEFPLTAYTNTALPSYVTSANAGQVWLRADTTGNADSLISNGTHLLSAGGRTVMLSAPARSLAGGMQTCSLYLDPPIKVFANARWYSMVTNGLSAYDNMNTVSFPLTMKNGAPVTGNYLGFIVVNHSPTVNVYVSVDIWPRVN